MEKLEFADFTEKLICFLFVLNTFSFTSEDGNEDTRVRAEEEEEEED